jgi:hypothetical protein
MKILVIIISHEMSTSFFSHILIFDNYMKLLSDKHKIEYAGISSQDDFKNYEDIISFKYKMVNPKRQITKLCDFITQNKDTLDYDLFIKIRPEIILLEQLNLDNLVENAINARARVYTGPRNIKYGLTVGGRGIHNHIKDYRFDLNETHIVLGDMFIIFDKNIVNNGTFHLNDYIKEYLDNHEVVHNEYTMTRIYNTKGTKLNVIGVNMLYYKRSDYYSHSGDIIHHEFVT